MVGSFQRQTGVALISVLLIFALVAIIAGDMLVQRHLDARRSLHHINTAQARQYLLGGEVLARQVLWEDQQRGDAVDTLSDTWASDLLAFELDEGKVKLLVMDRQAKFNINNLLTENGTIDVQEKARFQRLLEVLAIDINYAEFVADWLDLDQLSAEGAEDAYYLSKDLPYSTANRRLSDVSELRLIGDLPAEDYEKLIAHVTAIGENTAININTASAEVINAIFPQLSPSQARDIVSEQDVGGFESLAAFATQNALSVPSDDVVTVSSRYFTIKSVTEFRNLHQVLYSQVHRDQSSGKVTTISRHFGERY